MEKEIWKTIECYPNYMVSNFGRVKSLGNDKNRKEKILKSGKCGGGYLFVNLCKEGKVKKFKVHRLVASTFLPNPDNLLEINHIDEDKTNNRVENIEYCDRSYNVNYGSRNKRMAKSRSIPILQFTKSGEFIRRWESSTQIKREIGFNQSNINMCCKGKLKLAYGYIWMYANIGVFEIDINKLKKVA